MATVLTGQLSMIPQVPSRLDVQVSGAKLETDKVPIGKSAWFVLSVDGGQALIPTPARPIAAEMIFDIPISFTFIPNERPYLYVTMCTFGPKGPSDMVALARSRSALVRMDMKGGSYHIPLLNEQRATIGSLNVKCVLTQEVAQGGGVTDTQNPYASITPVMATDNPYEPTYQNPQTNPYENTQANPYLNPQANPYENPQANPYQNPQPNPYQNPQANPYQDPQANPYQNPQANPYQNPQANPYANPQAGMYPGGQPVYGAPQYQTPVMQGSDGTKYFL